LRTDWRTHPWRDIPNATNQAYAPITTRKSSVAKTPQRHKWGVAPRMRSNPAPILAIGRTEKLPSIRRRQPTGRVIAASSRELGNYRAKRASNR